MAEIYWGVRNLETRQWVAGPTSERDAKALASTGNRDAQARLYKALVMHL